MTMLNKPSLLNILVLVLLATGQAMAQGNPNPNADIDDFIEDEMMFENFPGVSTVIVKDGQIVWLQSYGLADVQNTIPVTDSTAFLLASVSKLFTGMAAMHLQDNGGASIDDNVNAYLPFELSIPGHSSSEVTWRQLMTHTSSIADNFDVMDTYYDTPDPSLTLAECMQLYLDSNGADFDAEANFIDAVPGTTYEYSNIGTALSGYLVELASETPFDAYCETALFEPMCMENTGWFLSDFDSSQVARPYRFQGSSYIPYPHYGFADYPSGQLRSTSLDMANFMITMLNEGSFGGEEVLSSQEVDEMLSQQIPDVEDSQGLNWYLETIYHGEESSLLWGHNGGEAGSTTDLYIDPVNNIGVCVLTNGEGDAIYMCDGLYTYALTLSASSGYPPGCLTTNISETASASDTRELVKVIDYLGRETELRPHTPLIKIFSDGSVERVMIVE